MSERVLFVTFIPDMSRPSGYRARVLSEMETTGRLGVRSSLLALTPLQTLARGEARRAFGLELERRGLAGRMVPYPPSLRSSLGKRLMALAASAAIVAGSRRLNATIVHAESQAATIAALTARAATRIPVVFDAHGVGPEEAELDGISRGVPGRRRTREVSLAREWECRCWLESDAVVAVSAALIRHLAERYGPRDNAVVIPCATNDVPTPDPPRRRKTRHELGIADRDVFVYVGSLAPYQLAPDMLRWFAGIRQRLPSAFLLVVSQAPRSAWERLARGAGVPRDAYRVVGVPHHEVPIYLAAADIGLMLRADSPVNRVAFPTKLAEYLATGVPVLTTDALHDPAGLVKEYNLGLVLSAGRAPDLDAVERFVLAVGEDREGWSRRCRATAAELLTWGRYAATLLSTYEAARDSRPGRAAGGQEPSASRPTRDRPDAAVKDGG